MMRTKIFLITIVLMVFIMSMVSYYSYQLINRLVLEKAYTSNFTYLNTVQISFENLIVRSKPIIQQQTLHLNQLLDQYEQVKNLADKISFVNTLNLEEQNFINNKRGFTGVMVITEQESIYSGSFLHAISMDEIKQHPIYQEMISNKQIAYTSSKPFTLKSMILFAERSHSAQGTGETIILYALDPERIISTDINQSSLVIFNQKREVIWASSEDLLPTNRGEQISLFNDIFSKREGSAYLEDYYVTYIHPPIQDFIYVNMIELNVLKEELFGLRRTILYILIAMCLVFILSAKFIIAKLLMPLILLKNAISSNSEMSPYKKANLYARFTMRNKLIVFLCLHTIVPAIILIAVIYLMANQLVLNKTKEAMESTIKQTANNISFLESDIEEFTKELATNNDIQSLLLKGAGNEELSKRISQYIVKQNPFVGSLPSINIYDMTGLQLYSTSNLKGESGLDSDAAANFLDDPYLHTVWLGKKVDLLGNQVNTFMRKIRLKYSDDFIYGKRQEDIGLLQKGVYSLSGIVKVDLLEKSLEDRYRSLQWGEDSSVFIIDSAGDIISHKDKQSIGTSFTTRAFMQTLAQDRATQLLNGDNLQIYYPIEGANNWYLAARIPTAEIQKDNIIIWINNIVVIIFVIAIIVICSFLFSWRITKPLTLLEGLMAKLETGDYSVQLPYGEEKDELTLIARRFNLLINKINALINEVFASKMIQKELEISKQQLERRKKEAEIIAFQSQINPHFLYNTFASINFMIALGKNEDAMKMLDSVGRLFRKGVFRGEVVVVIEEEIEHVRAYLEIQQMRFGEKLRIEWNLDSEIMNHKMIKLTLQPLVENAIYHGIELKDGMGEIRIEGKLIDGQIAFIIMDNGLGMSSAKLEQIHAVLHGGETKQIGLKNVDERIKLYFGETYGLQVSSKINNGTKVTMHIPIL
jgi:two-component system sensor histidine kinase YesM